MITGFLLVNKPSGPTSHDIVDRIRRITGERTVGHAGTLDPFATGVLIVGVGREATREFPRLVGLDKRYRAVVHLGATSDTDDRTGKITTQTPPSPLFIKEGVGGVLERFVGKIQQVPPLYSAKKIGGKKMYEYARAGVHVARRPSLVEIYEIKLTTNHYPLITLKIHCGSGTYIRALARDIGHALGTGAYLEELERTAVGPFTLETAVALDKLNKENWERYLHSVNNILNTIPPLLL